MIVNRILQIIKYKGINKRKFYIETGLSNGFLDKVKDIGVSKIDHILDAYPEISVIWLITGRGKMLLNSVSDAEKDKVEEPSTNIYLSASTKQQVPLYDRNTPNGVTSLFQDSNQNPIDFISIPSSRSALTSLKTACLDECSSSVSTELGTTASGDAANIAYKFDFLIFIYNFLLKQCFVL